MIKCWKLGDEIYLKPKFLPIFFDWSRGTASWEISDKHLRGGVVDRAAFNTQNHSSVKNGTSLESSKLLEFQGSKRSIVSVRFHAEVPIFVLRRPLFADRRKCLKISVCPGLETVSNNGNMPYPMATLSQIGRRSFLLTPSNPSTYRHNRPPLMVLDWNLADFWPSCNRVAELLIRHILSKTISCFFYGRAGYQEDLWDRNLWLLINFHFDIFHSCSHSCCHFHREIMKSLLVIKVEIKKVSKEFIRESDIKSKRKNTDSKTIPSWLKKEKGSKIAITHPSGKIAEGRERDRDKTYPSLINFIE